MIILKGILCDYLKSVQVELPRANMVIDPRPNFPQDCTRFRCDYHDNGTTVTLTRLDERWSGLFYFRVYNPATETVPSFDSTIFTYMGVDNERAPKDTTLVIIHPSVRVIKKDAFYSCSNMEKCLIHDEVHTIEKNAFFFCSAMKVIRLSRSLTYIGQMAFFECSSLEAVFLPPSLNKIDEHAFPLCKNLRILPLPLNIDISLIGEGMLGKCDNFFQTTQIEEYHYDDVDVDREDEEDNRVHQDIIDFYRDQVPPLHKASLDTHVTHQTIHECINTHGQATAFITDHDGMTPLHILAMNPHANISALLACFDLNMSSVFVGDSRGNTPLDYLRVHHEGIKDHTLLVTSLCMHRYAAGLSQDDQEMSTNKKRKRANDDSFNIVEN